MAVGARHDARLKWFGVMVQSLARLDHNRHALLEIHRAVVLGMSYSESRILSNARVALMSFHVSISVPARASIIVSALVIGWWGGSGAVKSRGQDASVGAAIWTVPEIGALSNDASGRLVRRGRDLITATYAHIGPEVPDRAKRYAGNNLACSNCHLEAGTKKFGIPLFGLFTEFPRYSPRSGAEISIEDRVSRPDDLREHLC